MNSQHKAIEPDIPLTYFQTHKCTVSPEKLSNCKIKCGKFRRFILNLTTAQINDIRAKHMYKSYALLAAEKYHQFKNYPFSIHPYSTFRFYADVMSLLIIFLCQTVTSVYMTQIDPVEREKFYNTICFLDFLYVITIILNFFTGYIEGYTCLKPVYDFKKIFCHYCKTWFIVDLVSVGCIFDKIFIDDSVRFTMALLVLKVLRLPIMFRYTSNFLTAVNAGLAKKTALQIFLIMFSYITWNIIFQFAVEYMHEDSYDPVKPRNCSWITLGDLWKQPAGLRYIYGFERAMTMLRESVNERLLHQTESCFEIFHICAWIFAKLIILDCSLRYVIMLFGTDAARAKYYMMIKDVMGYMKQRKLPPSLKERILKYHSIRFQSHYFVESRLMSCISGQLREDIIMHTGRQLVRDVAFLRSLPRPLLIQLGMKLKISIHVAGDVIFKINSLADSIYFIDKGTVAEYSPSGKEVSHREDGDYFGETAITMNHRYRVVTAVAVTNCELYRLDREDFDNTIGCYPLVYEMIKKAATSRFERICVLDEQHKTRMKMRDERKTRNQSV